LLTQTHLVLKFLYFVAFRHENDRLLHYFLQKFQISKEEGAVSIGEVSLAFHLDIRHCALEKLAHVPAAEELALSLTFRALILQQPLPLDAAAGCVLAG
jgi:hypothetical protein